MSRLLQIALVAGLACPLQAIALQFTVQLDVSSGDSSEERELSTEARSLLLRELRALRDVDVVQSGGQMKLSVRVMYTRSLGKIVGLSLADLVVYQLQGDQAVVMNFGLRVSDAPGELERACRSLVAEFDVGALDKLRDQDRSRGR